MTELTIFIPSKRPLATAAEAIESAIIFAEKRDALLVVSDNSGDPQKRARFEGASPRLVYLISPEASWEQNWWRAFSAAETPFVMPMGDDDAVYALDGEVPVTLSELGADVVGARPRTAKWSLGDGVRSVERFALTDNSAELRISAYSQHVRGVNSLYYAAYRRQPFGTLMQFFSSHHPTGGGYCDWAMVFALIACGKVVYDPSILFRYDLGQWANKAGVEEANNRLFEQAGIGGKGPLYDALLRFVDGFLFLSIASLPIEPDQRDGAQTLNAKLALSTFAATTKKDPQNYPSEVHAFIAGFDQFLGTADCFVAALPLLDVVKPGLGNAYREAWRAALET